MKVYSIGREEGCDIVINDNTDVISRRHATLTVTSSGKMTITDLSHNGTYVNGIRISQNVPVPVTRKDNISFAHVARLDWNSIPNSGAVIIQRIAVVVAALLIIAGGIWGISSWMDSNNPSGEDVPGLALADSATLKEEQKKLEEIENVRKDSIRKAVQDSINKVRQKEKVKKPSAKTSSKKGRVEEKTEKTENTDAKKPEPQQKRKRG